MRNQTVRRLFILLVSVAAMGAVMVGAASWATNPQNIERMAAMMELAGITTSPVIVLGGGMEVYAGDRVVRVYGSDSCPVNEGIMALLFGADIDTHDCVALDKPVIRVRLIDLQTGQIALEDWTVRADGHRKYVTRSDGSFIRSVRHS
jgi:hypothetical protein